MISVRRSTYSDLPRLQSYALEDDGVIVGAFAFIPGKDPTYDVVYGGEWIDDELPYATIHRLASSKDSHGIAYKRPASAIAG